MTGCYGCVAVHNDGEDDQSGISGNLKQCISALIFIITRPADVLSSVTYIESGQSSCRSSHCLMQVFALALLKYPVIGPMTGRLSGAPNKTALRRGLSVCEQYLLKRWNQLTMFRSRHPMALYRPDCLGGCRSIGQYYLSAG